MRRLCGVRACYLLLRKIRLGVCVCVGIVELQYHSCCNITMWFKKSVPRHLPAGKGPYVPGCADVMLDYSKSGLFMRLFYPTKSSPAQENYCKWPIWYADKNYIAGIAYSLFVNPIIMRFIFWLYGTYKVHIPSLYGEKANTDVPLKCILFSHGYGGSRELYTVICNELASRGYLVCVLEHRDGSSGFTYYYKSKEDAIHDIKTSIELKKFRNDSTLIENRNKQVHERSDECCKLLDFLINLNNGIVPHNVLDDVKENKKHDFQLQDLVGKLDEKNITIAGHSFGGATALLTLSRRKELKHGILLDAWMVPLKSEADAIKNTNQPLLFVNTETFHSLPSIRLINKLVSNNSSSEVFTILQTTHESQVDSTFVFGHWLHLLMKKLDINRSLNITNGLTLKFLQKQMQHNMNIEDMEKILKEEEPNFISGSPIS